MTDLLVPELTRRPMIDEELTCVAVEQVTRDVRSFVLSRADGSPLAFEPGQYLTVTVEVDGEELQRCYTIASSPLHGDRPTITVKRVPDGPVSGFLHERFGVGDLLRVTGPHGRFTNARHPAPAYLFLSAGSGITPLMSMTRALHGGAGPADVVFVHSARSPRDIIFRSELDVVAGTPGFEVAVVCETVSDDDGWHGATGFLGLRTLLRVAPDLHDREIFSCGPPAYMAAVREALDLAGVDPERCHEESFDLGSPTLAAEGPATGTPHTVEFRRSARSVTCRSDETVLRAALRAGLRPPSMCGQGVCGTCRTSLLDGEVAMDDAGGLRPADAARGEILLCCSRPCGDLVVDA